jgi:hypothetical protein
MESEAWLAVVPVLTTVAPEILKLLAQFAFAAFVAWLTVQWALDRYKSEKRWDRETNALIELIAAISELYRVNAQWLNDEAEARDVSDAADTVRLERYRAAKMKLEEVTAVAAVVLPRKVEVHLNELKKRLDYKYADWIEDLVESDRVLLEAREYLARVGRERMQGKSEK